MVVFNDLITEKKLFAEEIADYIHENARYWQQLPYYCAAIYGHGGYCGRQRDCFRWKYWTLNEYLGVDCRTAEIVRWTWTNRHNLPKCTDVNLITEIHIDRNYIDPKTIIDRFQDKLAVYGISEHFDELEEKYQVLDLKNRPLT